MTDKPGTGQHTMSKGPPAAERIENVANEMLGSAFCADWHDDPEVGVREVQRIKKLFVCRLVEFLYDELQRDRETRPAVSRPNRGGAA